MSMAEIRYEAEDGIARLVIDQPGKLNAMTYEMWASLPGLVARAEADPEVRTIVVAGAGERAFCAGADISQFGDRREGEVETLRYDAAYLAGCAALAHAKKPAIAVIRGICFGGGFGLAMSCDIRLARDDARFRMPAARLGLGYAYEGVRMLVAKLGLGPASDLLLSARILDGEEALRMGIVNCLWSPANFEAQAGGYLAQIAANAPLTLRAVKHALSDLMRTETEREPAAVEASIAACFSSADYREGQHAFKEKRTPVFTGR
jgi:enoyl-CoA hydratase/carnithine racemase